MTDLTPAQFVRHTKKAEWGVGTLLSDEGPPFRYQFEDGEARAFTAQGLAMLSAITVEDAAAAAQAAEAAARAAKTKKKPSRAKPEAKPAERAASVERQIQFFYERFPDGFEDERYLEDERGIPGTRKAGRLGSVVMAREELAIDAMREVLLGKHGVGAFALLRKVIQKSRGFLEPEELLPLSGLVGDALIEQRFCETFFDLVHGRGPLTERFETFTKIVPAPSATWQICTLAGALFDPERQLFVSPQVVFHQSELLGSPIRAMGRPSGTLYVSMVDMMKKLGESLAGAGLNPRDLLDVYAFSLCSQLAPPARRS